VTPVYYVTFTTATISASVILFQGFYDTDTVQLVSIFCGFITIFTGVFLLNSTRGSTAQLHKDVEDAPGAGGGGGSVTGSPYRPRSNSNSHSNGMGSANGGLGVPYSTSQRTPSGQLRQATLSRAVAAARANARSGSADPAAAPLLEELDHEFFEEGGRAGSFEGGRKGSFQGSGLAGLPPGGRLAVPPAEAMLMGAFREDDGDENEVYGGYVGVR
ncbi:hypothetical protein HDU93_003095, partial [Gonapodya sp. JEL0774]